VNKNSLLNIHCLDLAPPSIYRHKLLRKKSGAISEFVEIFVAYLTARSVYQVLWCRLRNDWQIMKWKRFRRKWSLSSEGTTPYFHEGTKRAWKSSIWIGGVSVAIRTGDLPNTSQKRYRLTQLFRSHLYHYRRGWLRFFFSGTQIFSEIFWRTFTLGMEACRLERKVAADVTAGCTQTCVFMASHNTHTYMG
jgi:hypothetical protein